MENERARERAVDRKISRFQIRVLEVGIHHKEVRFEHRGRRRAGRAGDDAVRRNHREAGSGEAILKSSGSYPIRKHCRTKGGNCWIEGVIGTLREIVRVAVVGKRRIADSESSAKYGRFFPTVGQPYTRREVFVMSRDPEVIRIAGVAAYDERVSGGGVILKNTLLQRGGEGGEKPHGPQHPGGSGGEDTPFIYEEREMTIAV